MRHKAALAAMLFANAVFANPDNSWRDPDGASAGNVSSIALVIAGAIIGAIASLTKPKISTSVFVIAGAFIGGILEIVIRITR